MPIAKFMFAILLGLLFAYVGWEVYEELRLIRLLESEPSGKEQPVIFDEIPFKDARSMEEYRLEGERNKFAPWTAPMEQWLCLLVLGFSVGWLGGVVRFALDFLDRRRNPKIIRCFTGSLLSIGLMAVAWVSERILLEGESKFRIETLAAVSFLGGIFVEQTGIMLKT